MKCTLAPSVMRAAKVALRDTAREAQLHRGNEKRLKASMADEKNAAELAELELEQLELFLRDAGVSEHEIKQLKGDST